MSKIPCENCGCEIQPATAKRNNGLCQPCSARKTLNCTKCGKETVWNAKVWHSHRNGLCESCFERHRENEHAKLKEKLAKHEEEQVKDDQKPIYDEEFTGLVDELIEIYDDRGFKVSALRDPDNPDAGNFWVGNDTRAVAIGERLHTIGENHSPGLGFKLMQMAAHMVIEMCGNEDLPAEKNPRIQLSSCWHGIGHWRD